MHVDYMPRLHRPQPQLLIAVGCQGRGIAWQTAMGAELARIVIDPHYDPVLPFSPVRPHSASSAEGASASPPTIAAYRALDRLGFS